ncbi:hypothetical protein GJ744_000820 [Endocarpon pusillum]|uniref:Protein kinase domain-containing protein n=1 Tax=Endocarpon pusillum TaxID=364733 RepID=A0A8H7E6T6_9EURO|nr:hypothetical protein GJ744_000820 [Endocarpon pusillum]
MANAPGQPAYEPEIAKFIKWVEEHSEKGTLGRDPVPRHPFMPLPRLESYLKENDRTKRLIKALFPNSEPPPIEPQAIWRSCIRGFSILLLIGKGTFIPHFIQHEQLWDHKPFFNRPPHFPTAPGDDSFFDVFIKKQWLFYPHTFHADGMNAQIDKECILPIVHKELLGEGGSAFTYKIKLYPAYDQLSDPKDIRRDAGYQYANTYVLKTYRFKDARDSYETEVRAFRALMPANVIGKSIISFFGSYEQDDTYNILLEYADRGTLEDYLQRTPPPTTGSDIYKFWSALFNVIKALVSIHNVQGENPSDPPVLRGWHQDVNPSNILVKSGKSGSQYDCEFKIADLGLSHFRKVQVSRGTTTDKDTSGTREYGKFVHVLGYPFTNTYLGAPECYRFDTFMEQNSFGVDQTVDVWSLGCIFSEVAVWLVHGKHQLGAYREARQHEIQQLHNFKDGRAFHDSKTVLETVSIFHNHVVQNVRQSDHVTKPVVEKLIAEMLVEVDGRSTARQLWYKAGKILEEACKKLELPRGEDRQLDPRPLRRVPPVLPPNLGNPQPDRSAWNGEPQRWVPVNRGQQQRSLTFDSVPPVLRAETPTRQLIAEPESTSPGAISNDTVRPQASPLAAYVGTHSQYQDPIAYDIFNGPSLPSQRSQNGRTHPDHFPKPENTAWDRDSASYNNHSPGHLRDRSLLGPLSVLNIGDSHERSTNSTHPEDLSSHHNDQDLPLFGNVQNITANMVPSSPQARNHARRTFPYITVESAQNWILNTKQQRSTYHPLQHMSMYHSIQYRSTYHSLQHKELLDKLKERDHVFLVDDAATMSLYWPELLSVFHVLAYFVKHTDDDGLDLRFTISGDRYNSTRSSTLLDKLQMKTLVGTSDIESSLGDIVHEYQMYLQQPESNRRFSFTRAKPKGKKALSVYVLTDAVWQPRSNAAEPVSRLVSTLKDLKFPRKQVGIQFVRFGNDPEGVEKLQRLDSGLGLPMDIVDTEPADGNVWKMLLGAVDKWFDDDEGGEEAAAAQAS